MASITAFITRHQVLAYFVLAFAISWSFVLLVIGGIGAIPATVEESDRLFPFAYLAMLTGPSIAGLLMTALTGGGQGLRELRDRMLAWRVAPRWYAAALLSAPLAASVVLLSLSAFSPAFVPRIFAMEDWAGQLAFGIVVGLGAGVFEELGWTGFATPAMRRHDGVLSTGLVVGLAWGAWHLLVMLWGIGDGAGAMPPALFVTLDLVTFLPAYRVLMVGVYDRTGSLLVAMLMHASLTATTLILLPQATGVSGLIYDVALAAVLWLVMAAVVLSRRHLPHVPLAGG